MLFVFPWKQIFKQQGKFTFKVGYTSYFYEKYYTF